MSSQNIRYPKFTQEELDAIKVLAKYNKVVYVNKNATGIGTFYLNNSLMRNLVTLDLKANTNTDVVELMKINVEVSPIYFQCSKEE